MSTEPAPTPAMDINPFTEQFWVQTASDLANTVQDVVKKAIYAIVVLIVGYIVIAIINFVLKKVLAKTKLDPLVQSFARRVIVFILKMLLWTFIIGIINLDILSVSALIAAIGVAIGFTLSGLLGNFIAGCILLTKKPFKVGDFVNVAGVEGSVKTIEIFSTMLATGDNKLIFVPNGQIVSSVIVNVTAEPTRRIDLEVPVAYSTDIPAATKVLLTLLDKNAAVLKEPEPVVRVAALADSSVNFVVRPWCKTEDYFTTKCAIIEEIKKRFHAAGIVMPRPTTDVHLADGQPTVPKEIEWSESDEDDAPTAVVPEKSSVVHKAKTVVGAVAAKAKGAASRVTNVFKSKKAAADSAAAASTNDPTAATAAPASTTATPAAAAAAGAFAAATIIAAEKSAEDEEDEEEEEEEDDDDDDEEEEEEEETATGEEDDGETDGEQSTNK